MTWPAATVAMDPMNHKGLAIIGLVVWLAACSPAPRALPPEQLAIRINLLCTTCDDFLRCQVPAAPQDSFRLYRLREQGFWTQVATIWDYLIQRIRPKTAHSRPVTVYAQQGETREVLAEGGEARVDAVTGLITLPDGDIDMRDGRWRDRAASEIGRCTALTRREGYAWVRALLGRPLPGGGR